MPAVSKLCFENTEFRGVFSGEAPASRFVLSEITELAIIYLIYLIHSEFSAVPKG